jgi:D-threo-aldose 1-dehydrogenase
MTAASSPRSASTGAAGPGGSAGTSQLRSRPLGRSPVRVTELSFGAAAIGNLFTPVSDHAAAAAVAAAWAGGIRAFDTAPHYGLGLSERRLGAALREYPRDDYVVSTKVGRLLEPATEPYGADAEGFAVPAAFRRVRDYSADGVRRSLAASLDRLGLDRIDIALIHDPDEHFEQAMGAAYPALEELRAQGCVRAIGVGMNEAAMLTRFVTDTDVDVVLVAGRYTLLDQSAGQELLPAAQERGISVLAGGVFNSGLLAAPQPGATYDYEAAPGPLIARAGQLEAVCAQFGVPLRAAAARFPLRHPAVAGVLVGARGAAEVTDALALWQHDIPAGLWTALAAAGVS